jgi:hypothetical protein
MRLLGLLLLFSLCASAAARAQSTTASEVPQGGLPADKLERMEVGDPSRRLPDAEKHDLCRLFVRTHVLSIKGGGQGQFLSTRAPVYRLFAANFPGVTAREREGGSLIYLGEVVRYINSMPDYKQDVISVLRENAGKKKCR